MTRELTKQELEAVTLARLAYESELDLRLYTLRDVGLFQDGFRAGLEYQESQLAQGNDSRADDLAQEWIVKHTHIELDGKAYRELVRAFLQFGQVQTAELAALQAENAKLRAALNMVNTRIDDGGGDNKESENK